MQDAFTGLFAPFKEIPRRKLLKVLADKALVAWPTLFDTKKSQKVKGGLFNRVGATESPLKEWAAKMHVSAAAVAVLDELGVSDAGDVSFLEPADGNVLRRRVVVLRTPGAHQHGGDEL
jgi:hypothetical protein